MAITAAHLITNGSTSQATSYTTASFTPTANNLVLAWILSTKTVSPSPLAPTLTGNGLTWVQVATVTFNTIATGLNRLTLFRAMSAAPTAGTLVISFGSVTQQGCGWAISQYAGVETSSVNGANAIRNSDTGNGDAVTTLGANLVLPAFANSFNATAAGFALASTSAVTPEAGWTEFAEFTYNSPSSRIQSQWIAANDVTPSATWTSSNAAGIAVELVAGIRRAQVSWVELEVPGAGGAFVAAVDGVLSMTSTLILATMHGPTGSVTSAGAIARDVSHLLAGTL